MKVVVGALALGVAVASAVFFVLGWWDDRVAPPIVISDPLADAGIVVAVEGAVATPGVYSLPAGGRVGDALRAAGGPAAGADLSAINQAKRLADGERMVVPSRPGGGGSPPTVGAIGSSAAASPPQELPATIDINAATADELATLPGIGPAIAQRIVDHRAANGPFGSVEELADVSGVSLRMVDALRPLVRVGP